MTADFNWFLNKQGPRGQQGVKGEQGFSPVITVAENTAKAYILRIQTQDDTFLTPNLRGTVEDLGGTYVRYNPETGQVYAGSPDVATTETYGVIRLATQQDIADLAQDAAVTPELLANQIEALDLSKDYVTINTTQTINASKVFTNGISLSSIHNVDGEEVLNFVSGGPFKFKTWNNGLNVEGGTLRVTDGSIKSKSIKQLSTDANVYDVVTSFDLATTENAGIVKPDGSTIFIGENGVISAKSGAIDDSNTSTQSTWSSSKINTEISTVAQEVVGIQGDVASLNADVSTLKPTVESHTTSIGAINDSIAIAMSDITELKEGKQDKLTAGNNITIEGNVISSTGGVGGSGTQIKSADGAEEYSELFLGDTLAVAGGVLNAKGSGLELCDIGMALYVDETKGLRRYLNGQIVDINTNTQAFFTRLQEITTLHPSLLCTEEEWQTAKTMSAFGQVGKFVFNYSGNNIVSVRLPRVVNVQGLFDLQNLGMTVEAGLPNITGYISGDDHKMASIGGAFYHSGTASGQHCETVDGSFNIIQFNASRVSTIYGKSATVQQEAIQYPYFIQIATGSETKVNIVNTLENVNGFTLLESKYSDKPLYNESWLLSNGQWNAKAVYSTVYEGLQVEYNSEIEVGTTVTLPSGVSYTKRGLSVKLSTEEYTDYDFVLNTADETFRLPLKTKLASGKAVVGNGIALGITDGTHNHTVVQDTVGSKDDDYGLTASTSALGSPVGSASANYASDMSKVLVGVTTDPSKSGIELSDSGLYLYFYVGETVQNANLIDAGRIGEQLASKQDKLIRYPIEVSDKSLMPSWYVVYNDGWCEQGGHVTSDRDYYFIKSFVSTPNLTFGNISSLDGNPRATVCKNTYFHYQSSMKANVPADWVAKGYIS